MLDGYIADVEQTVYSCIDRSRRFHKAAPPKLISLAFQILRSFDAEEILNDKDGGASLIRTGGTLNEKRNILLSDY